MRLQLAGIDPRPQSCPRVSGPGIFFSARRKDLFDLADLATIAPRNNSFSPAARPSPKI
jgi:hypothetical protein